MHVADMAIPPPPACCWLAGWLGGHPDKLGRMVGGTQTGRENNPSTRLVGIKTATEHRRRCPPTAYKQDKRGGALSKSQIPPIDPPKNLRAFPSLSPPLSQPVWSIARTWQSRLVRRHHLCSQWIPNRGPDSGSALLDRRRLQLCRLRGLMPLSGFLLQALGQ